MSLRLLLRRLPATRLVALLVFSVAMTAGTTSAMASGQTIRIQSCTPASGQCPADASSAFPAGGDPSLLTTVTLDSTQATTPATSATVALKPGVFASASAKPSCISTYSSPEDPNCTIGGGTVNTSFGNPAFIAYLTPAKKTGDIAGVDLVSSVGTVHGEVSLVQSASNAPVSMVMTFDLSALNAAVGSTAAKAITGLTLYINGTLNGQPFLRMPTNCGTTAATALSVTYGTGTTPVTSDASPDVTPTGCSTLPYAPKLAATVTKDSTDSGVDVTTVVTQAANESANASVQLVTPSGTISPNLVAAIGDFGKQVGVASAISPLLPVKLTGTVSLTGSAAAPALTITFPGLATFSGAINLGNNSVTFGSVPDVPLTNLTVDITGGPNALFMSTCSQPTGTLTGNFVGQNGAKATSSSTVTVSGCSTPTGGGKTVKPSLTGLKASGFAIDKPKLMFTIKAGSAKVKGFTVALPKGVTFIKKGLKQGVILSGAKIKSEKLVKGKLVVTLKSAATRIKVTLNNKALNESVSLALKIAQKKVKSLTGKVTVTDTTGKNTTLPAKFNRVS